MENTEPECLQEFVKYRSLFEGLTIKTPVDTSSLDVISMVITYDSKYCLALVNSLD